MKYHVQYAHSSDHLQDELNLIAELQVQHKGGVHSIHPKENDCWVIIWWELEKVRLIYDA